MTKVHLVRFHSKTGTQTKSSQHHNTKTTRLAEWTSYPFLRNNDTGTTEYGYLGCGSTVFGLSFRFNDLPLVCV